MSGFIRMCNASGSLVGYSFLELNCETGLTTRRFQALGTTTTTTTLPAGWEPCCSTEDASGFFPMFTTADDPTTLVGYVFIQADELTAGATVYTQQYIRLSNGAVTTTLPAGWLPGACGSTSGGGGGGTGTVLGVSECAELYLMAGTVIDEQRYPDWGIPSLSQANRKDKLIVPPGYDGADWSRFSYVIENVAAPLSGPFTLQLLDLTNSVTVGNITVAAGTAPINGEIYRSQLILSGSFTDNTNIQWYISDAPDGNNFGLHAWGCYELIVETPS